MRHVIEVFPMLHPPFTCLTPSFTSQSQNKKTVTCTASFRFLALHVPMQFLVELVNSFPTMQFYSFTNRSTTYSSHKPIYLLWLGITKLASWDTCNHSLYHCRKAKHIVFICVWLYHCRKAKHSQLTSGAKWYTFWLSNFFSDMLIYTVPAIVTVVTIKILGVPYVSGIVV